MSFQGLSEKLEIPPFLQTAANAALKNLGLQKNSWVFVLHFSTVCKQSGNLSIFKQTLSWLRGGGSWLGSEINNNNIHNFVKFLYLFIMNDGAFRYDIINTRSLSIRICGMCDKDVKNNRPAVMIQLHIQAALQTRFRRHRQ